MTSIDLAKDLVTAMNTTALLTSQVPPLIAERSYLPIVELKDLGARKIFVVPKATDEKVKARGVDHDDFQLDVGVLEKLTNTDVATVDPIATLTEQIKGLWRPGGELRDAAVSGCDWIKMEHGNLFLPEHLQLLSQWTSVFTVTYRIEHE